MNIWNPIRSIRRVFAAVLGLLGFTFVATSSFAAVTGCIGGWHLSIA